MGCVPSKDEPGPSVTGRDALWQSTLDPKKRSPPVLIELKSCQAAERKQYWTSNEYKRTMDPVIGLENGQLKLRDAVYISGEPCSGGPLVRFPVHQQQQGVKPWLPADVSKLVDRLSCHNLYHGGEQLLFAGWVNWVVHGDKLEQRILVLTALGRIFVIKKGVTRTFVDGHTHVCNIENISAQSADDLVHVKTGLLYEGLEIDLSDGRQYKMRGPHGVLQDLAQAIHAVLTVAKGSSSLAGSVFKLDMGYFAPCALPSPPQDGGLHDSYTIWHNFYTVGMTRNQTPMPEKVEGCLMEDYNGKYAIESICEGLLELSLDVSTWDPVARMAIGQACSFNTVFKALVNRRVGGKYSMHHYDGIAHILRKNTSLLKLDLSVVDMKTTHDVKDAMQCLGEALADNPAPSFAHIDLSGQSLGASGVDAWSKALRKLRKKSLVVLSVGKCLMPDESCCCLIQALEPQVGSLQVLTLSHNSLGKQGTQALLELLKQPGLKTLELANSALDGEILVRSMESLKALTKLVELDLSYNTWHPAFDTMMKLCSNSLKALRLQGYTEGSCNWSKVLEATQGRDLVLDLSLSKMTKSIDISLFTQGGLILRSCNLHASGLQALFSTLTTSQQSKRAGPPPKILDVSENVLFLHSYLYGFLFVEWARPDFISAVEQAAQSGDIEEGTRWFYDSLDYAYKQAGADSDTEKKNLSDRIVAAKSLACVMKIPGIESLNIAGKIEQGNGYGPFLAVAFSLGLSYQCALTSLDVSNNKFANPGCIALAKALRTNRTLTSLRFDGNNVTTEGFKAIKGCLIGNKKLLEVPFPHRDMEAALGIQGALYKSALELELTARRRIAVGWSRGRPNYNIINPAMDELKDAKRRQSQARMEKNKLRTAAAEIQAFLLRNKKLASAKEAAKCAKQELKDAAEARKEASKAGEEHRRILKPIWQRRHMLMQRWIKAVNKIDKSGKKSRWWKEWVTQWAKPYLTKKALEELWSTVPNGEKESYQSTYEYCMDAFADEAHLLPEAHKVAIEAESAKIASMYLKKEAAYHGSLSAIDADLISDHARAHKGEFTIRPMIVNTPDPGKVTDAQIGASQSHPHYWRMRRSMLYQQLQDAIRHPPQDYEWREHVAVTPPQVQGIHRPSLVYGAPKVAIAEGFPHPQQVLPTNLAANPLEPPAQPGVAPSAPRTEYLPLTTPAASTSGLSKAYPNVQQQQNQGPQYPFHAYGCLSSTCPTGVKGYRAWNDYIKEHRRQAEKPHEHYNHKYHFTYAMAMKENKGKPPKDSKIWGIYNTHKQKRKKKMKMKPGSYQKTHFTYYYVGSHYPLWGGGYNSQSSDDDLNIPSSGDANIDPLVEQGEDDISDLGAPPEDFDDSKYQHFLNKEIEDVESTGNEYDHEVPGAGEVHEAGEHVDEGHDDNDDHIEDMGEADGMDMYGGAGPRDLPDGGRDDAEPGPFCSWGIHQSSTRPGHLWQDMDVCFWIEQKWLTTLNESNVEIFGPLEITWHDRDAKLISSKVGPSNCLTTLVTQLSMERLPQLEKQAYAWKGKMSVAVYLAAPRHHPNAEKAITKLIDFHHKLEATSACHMDISVMYANHNEECKDISDQVLTIVEVGHDIGNSCVFKFGSAGYIQELENTKETCNQSYSALYPINALRNLALQQASTELVFLLDVDFVPSNSLGDAVQGLIQGETSRAVDDLRASSERGESTMLIVPAFEVADDIKIPRTKLKALELLQEDKMSSFHIRHFPQGHTPTDFNRWQRATSAYSVTFKEYFEPYVIAARHLVPSYDERFQGYGMNKIAHLYAAAARGFQFKVIPDHFVAAHEHKKSHSHMAVFGQGGEPSHRVRIASMYRILKQEIICKVGSEHSEESHCNEASYEPSTSRSCRDQKSATAVEVVDCW